MTPRAQVVLLRFLQDHKYRPVGGRLLSAGNVRVIASTNIDLEHLVLQNKFRRDLLFRLSILLVTMPPLRHRTDDVLLLAEYFLHRFAVEFAKSTKQLHPDTVSSLLEYDWPGNVRELENMMLRELLLADGDLITIDPHRRLGAENVPANGFDAGHTFKTAKARAIAEFERSFLGHLLMKTGGNVSLAARICGKDRSSLNKLVKKHGLADETSSSSLD